MTDIKERLRAKCVGHPLTTIPWPHRLLHDALAEIERLENAIKVQTNAVNTLRHAEDTEINVLRSKMRQAHVAVTTLESERAMNAQLTAEIERLEAENAALHASNERLGAENARINAAIDAECHRLEHDWNEADVRTARQNLLMSRQPPKEK